MTRVMKILALVDRQYPCDHSFLEGLMEKRLTGLGHKILWVMKSSSPQQGISEKIWISSKCIVLPNRKRRAAHGVFRNYASLLSALFGLRSKIKEFSPDIIFVRNDPAYLLYAVIMSRKLNVPIIYQLSHLKEEDVIERVPYVDARTKVGYILLGVGGKFLRDILISMCDHVLPISKAMMHYLSTSSNIPEEKMTPVPLGVEDVPLAESNACERYGLNSGGYLLYVGTVATPRRLNVLVDAFELVLMSLPNLKLVFLGGATEPGARDKLIAYVASKKMGGKVVFIPQVPRKEVPYFIREAMLALSIMPAKGVLRMLSPTKLMEYLQQGCPVVATRGIPEQENIMDKSGGGLLVDFDPEDIAHGIVSLVGAPTQAKEMGKKGMKYILLHRNYDKMVYDVEKIFSSVLTDSHTF